MTTADSDDGYWRKIAMPAWTPPSVRQTIVDILNRKLSAEHVDIVERLATDLRMRAVWMTLRSKRRGARGSGYQYAARSSTSGISPEDAQQEALAKVFHFAFCTVRDNRKVTKEEESRIEKEGLLQDAVALRRIADRCGNYISHMPRHVIAGLDLNLIDRDLFGARRLAELCDLRAADIRDAQDPLTIINQSGDPYARANQIDIAGFLMVTFGDYLHGLSAILTAVARGLPESQAPDVQVSRSVFSKSKPPK